MWLLFGIATAFRKLNSALSLTLGGYFPSKKRTVKPTGLLKKSTLASWDSA
jgi:hypothetical protein